MFIQFNFKYLKRFLLSHLQNQGGIGGNEKLLYCRRRVLGKRMLKDKKMFSILLPILLGQGLPYADGGGKN